VDLVRVISHTRRAVLSPAVRRVALVGLVVALTIWFIVGWLSRLVWFDRLAIAIAVIVAGVALYSIRSPIRRSVTRFFTSGARARLRWCLYGLLVTASFALMFIIPSLPSDDSISAKVGDGVRTGVVVLALTVAVETYLSNSRNKRIDRVYAFHKELTVGSIGEARIRLNRLVYSQTPLRRISRSDVRKGPLAAYAKRRISRSEVRKGALAAYAKGNEHKPDYDGHSSFGSSSESGTPNVSGRSMTSRLSA
jgi:hypothetical protein